MCVCACDACEYDYIARVVAEDELERSIACICNSGCCYK